MVVSSGLSKFKSPNFKEIAPAIKERFSFPWVFTFTYLILMLMLPFTALITKSMTISPPEFFRIAFSPVAVSAYNVTFVTALFAGLINGVMGILIAWVLVRYDFFGKKLIDAAVDLPFPLPTSVAGLVLATVYSQNGWIGQFFSAFGVKIAFTRLGVFVAMLFISLPFVVRTLQPVMQEMEREIEEAAWSLGASQFQTFVRVLLPPLIPPILTGIALGFSRAVGEYGSVVIVSSSIPFQDLIAPVLVFQRLEQYDYVGATVIGTVLLIASLFLLVAINALQQWGRSYSFKD